MAQKWTDQSSSTNYDRLNHAGAIGPPVSLTDGTLVWIDTNNTNYFLNYSNTHTAVNNIVTLSNTVFSLSYGVGLCVDSSNNIYVCGSNSSGNGTAQAFLKGSGYSWTTEASLATSTYGYDTTGAGCLWVGDGGGTSSAGHILVMPGAYTAASFYTYDAGALLAGSGTLLVHTASGIAYPYGELSANGLGATSGIYAEQQDGHVYTWSVASSGIVTVFWIGTLANFSSTITGLNVVLISSGVWVVVYPDSVTAGSYRAVVCSGGSLGTSASSGTPANLPLKSDFGGPLEWSVFADPSTSNKFWLIAPGALSGTSLPVYRLSATVSGTAITWSSSVTADDTLTAYAALPDTFACVRQPVSTQYVDWMATEETSAGTFALLGDYTTLAITPSSTLVSPASGSYVDVTATTGPSVLVPTWAYSDTDGSTQAYWALRAKVSGAGSYLYWNNTSAAWQSTIVWNAGAQTSWTPPSGAFTNGNTYNWSAAVESSFGLQGSFPTDFTFVAQASPTATVTGPTGTQSTSQPTVTYTTTKASGASIISYRVMVYPQSVTTGGGFSPGVTAGAAFDTGVVAGVPPSGGIVTTALANETYFVPYMQVTESGNEASAWAAGAAFEEAYGLPSPPTLSAANGEDTNDVPAIVLTVDSTSTEASLWGQALWGKASWGGGGGSYGSSPAVTVTYSDANGSGTVRYGIAVPFTPGTALVIYDYEATPGVARTYTAVINAIAGGATVTSNGVMATATLSVTSWWAIAPLSPSTSISLQVTAAPTSQHESLAVHVPLSQTGVVTPPTVVAGGIQGQDGQVTVETQSLTQWQALKGVLAAGAVVWLMSPLGDGTYARISAANAVGGTSGAAHQTTVVGPSTTPVRTSTISYVAVSSPGAPGLG
jgi:hypothetical protein